MTGPSQTTPERPRTTPERPRPSTRWSCAQGAHGRTTTHLGLSPTVSRRRRTRSAAALALGATMAAATALGAGGCGAMDASGAGGSFSLNGDATAGTDVWGPASDLGPGPLDAGSLDAAADTTLPQDAGRDGGGKTDNPAPPPGPTRLSVALDGHRAAWVEVSPSGDLSLVAWDLSQPDVPPIPYDWPYLAQPRGLRLTDGWLVFVDEPYGDPDIFALRLGDGAVLPVVTTPGAQEHPAVLPPASPPSSPTSGAPAPPATTAAASVAWQDCRACVVGAPPTPAIYLRPLPHGAEAPLTEPGAANTLPVAGTLADGSPALAWLVEASAARIWSPGAEPAAPPSTDVTLALPFSNAAGIALTRGLLASRPSPLIINPDSMMPSDVFLTQLSTGQTRRVSTHAELNATTPAAPLMSGGRVAWLESRAGADGGGQRLVVVDVSAPWGSLGSALGDTLAVEDLQGTRGLALSDGWVGAIVTPGGPDETSDVWLQELP